MGLKDALGVFYRNHIGVTIHSKYSTISLTMAEKAGFDIQTLHAVFSESKYPTMVGTDVVLTGVKQADLQKAKSMFWYLIVIWNFWKKQIMAKYIQIKVMVSLSYMPTVSK